MEGLGFREPRACVEAERRGDSGLLGPEMTAGEAGGRTEGRGQLWGRVERVLVAMLELCLKGHKKQCRE